MGIPVMIFGESGSGKSSSLRNFKAGEVSVINVSKKPLPFRSTGIAVVNTNDYRQIEALLLRGKNKSVVIDDATYLLVDEFMRNIKTGGFQKYNDLALNFYTLVQLVINTLPPDKIVYFMGHVDTNENGKEHFKTIGKTLDNKVTLEGLFTVVLKTEVTDRVYRFSTQTNGADTVKSPMGMFDDLYIENDLQFVDKKIREFYGIWQEEKMSWINDYRYTADYGIAFEVPDGEHKVKILEVKETTSKKGVPMLEIKLQVWDSNFIPYVERIVGNEYFDKNMSRFFDAFNIVPGNFAFQSWRGKVGKGIFHHETQSWTDNNGALKQIKKSVMKSLIVEQPNTQGTGQTQTPQAPHSLPPQTQNAAPRQPYEQPQDSAPSQAQGQFANMDDFPEDIPF